MSRKIFLLFFSLFVTAALASAGDKLGVNAYPGAKLDADTTKFLKESMSVEAACFRTGDSVEKVIEFYKKQPGLKLISSNKEGGILRRCKEEYNEFLKKKISSGCDLDVTVQSPWMDMKTGKLMKDTLISIVKTAQ